jgi:hypothetical protein
VIVVVHVDDGICTGIKDFVIRALEEISSRLDVKTFDDVEEFLSVETRRGPDCLWIGQYGYIEELLTRFDMSDVKPVATPMPVGLTLTKEGKPVKECAVFSIGGTPAIRGGDDPARHCVYRKPTLTVHGKSYRGSLESCQESVEVPCWYKGTRDFLYQGSWRS